MSEDLDVNKVAADFLQQNLERIIQSATSTAKDVKNLISSRLNRTYRTYVTRLLERHARGKSFFVRSEPIPLYDFFVPLDLETQLRTLRSPDAVQLAQAAKLSFITGSGGSGKSMMMRHLLVSALRSGEKIPVFLELRYLNQNDEPLTKAIVHAMRASGLDVDDDFLTMALNAGQLFILLDGFDEVTPLVRVRLTSEIQQIADRYPKNWITLSSRPDSALQGWDAFTQFTLTPLDLDRAVELISKVPFDETVKKRLILDLRERLFEKHASFLSNPLLLSIMLLTYSDVAHIPHRMSTFYGQAFEALFHRHDALKSGYQRERGTGLDVQDFSRVFSAFCLLSYDRREFSFTYSRAMELLDQARDVSMLDFDTRNFLDDSVQAVCLLVEEGMEVAFTHRSFQEYFVARFVHTSPPELKAKLIERFAPTVESDAVMSLLHEMDPYIVEKYYILPKLAELRDLLQVLKKVGTTHHLRFLRLIYSEIKFNEASENEEDHLVAKVANRDLNLATLFTFNRYRDRSTLGEKSVASLVDAFKAEFGDATVVPTTGLRLHRPFLAAIRENGRVWSPAFVQAIFEIEDEIRTRHAGNKETLEDLLRSSKPRRQFYDG